MAREEIGRTVEIDTLAEFDRLAGSAGGMAGWRIRGIDLRNRTEVLLALDPHGALVLGCALEDEAERHLSGGGALVFPELPTLPFDPYRTSLYSPEELYAGLEESYDSTPDALSYAWSLHSGKGAAFEVARSLHDASVDEALTDQLGDRSVVGVMGGHGLDRTASGYREAALLGRDLARTGLHVATGGGPGTMEAANLGAYMSAADVADIDHALVALKTAPSFTPDVAAWARAAFEVRRRWPDGRPSLGIPTWFYGHEPPNALASEIAKFFQNSLREATLVRNANAGIVFLPGAGGTVQEIFQDACENYYAEPAAVAPMVLVGVEYWTETVPAWPLLRALAAGRAMEDHVHLVDAAIDVAAIVASRIS